MIIPVKSFACASQAKLNLMFALAHYVVKVANVNDFPWKEQIGLNTSCRLSDRPSKEVRVLLACRRLP